MFEAPRSVPSGEMDFVFAADQGGGPSRCRRSAPPRHSIIVEAGWAIRCHMPNYSSHITVQHHRRPVRCPPVTSWFLTALQTAPATTSLYLTRPKKRKHSNKEPRPEPWPEPRGATHKKHKKHKSACWFLSVSFFLSISVGFCYFCCFLVSLVSLVSLVLTLNRALRRIAGGLVFLLVFWVLAGACQRHGVGRFL